MTLLLIMQIFLILQCLYSSTSRSLWGFKRDEIDNNANVTNDNNAPSFKYKANLIGNTQNGVEIVVPLKY